MDIQINRDWDKALLSDHRPKQYAANHSVQGLWMFSNGQSGNDHDDEACDETTISILYL